MKLHFFAGTSIIEAAECLVAAAAEHGEATGKFNGIVLNASRCTTAAEVVAYFNLESDARALAYRNSPEGIAAARAADERRADLQARHDRLMRELRSLDFNNDVAVLDWCCAMQEPSDHIGIIVRRKTIVEAFNKHGFQPDVNCGTDFRSESRVNVHRWLVGQALSGLDTGPAIHGIIHKFAAEWKMKFITAGADMAGAQP